MDNIFEYIILALFAINIIFVFGKLLKTKKIMCKIVIGNVLSGHIILFIAVFSMIQKQYELLDICIIYVSLGFAATFALTSFMKKYDDIS